MDDTMNYVVNRHMLKTYELALNSQDPSTQNGAILIGETREVIGEGWNYFPEGVSDAHWYGPKEDKYARVVHAEVAAIISAARRGNSTINSTLICPWSACSNCSKHIAAAGIKTLIRHSFSNNGASTGSHWYADCQIGDEIMREAGVEIIECPPVETVMRLRRDGKLWPMAEVS